MSFNSPILQIGNSQIYEDGEEDYEVNLSKTLENLPAGGMKDGTVVVVEDFDQDMEINLTIAQMEFEEEDERGQFLVTGERVTAKANPTPGSDGAKADEQDDDDDDELLEVFDSSHAPLPPPPPPPSTSEGNSDTPAKKRSRLEEETGADENTNKKNKIDA